MWPYKDGLGIVLSYGVNGNGMVSIGTTKVDSKSKKVLQLEFPRIRDEGVSLNDIEKSNVCLVKSQVPLFTLNLRMYHNLEVAVISSEPQKRMYYDSKMYIPRDILKSYLVESQSLTSTIAYDPTYGQLFPISDIRSRNGQFFSKVMAYVSGESGNILNISSLNYERIEVKRSQDEDQTTEVLLPDLSKPFQIALTEPIKQIEFCKSAFDYIPSFIIVRTDSKIYVLNCFKSVGNTSLKSSIELDIIGELHTSDILGCEFADVTFNPWNYTQFGVVDVKGNFGIWNIRKNNDMKLKRVEFKVQHETVHSEKGPVPYFSCIPTVYDVTELSNWKRIKWTHDENTIIVMTRSSVTQFTITPNLSSLKLITSNTWSRIQDIFKSKEHAFLLTSKELIWFSLSSPVTRLISWKHFLDDNDPSLKLHVSEYDEGNRFICLIYSQMHPLIFVYNFEFKDEKPYSLKDPYYIRRGSKHGNLQHIFLVELNRQFYTPSKEIFNEDDLIIDSDSETSFSCKIFGLFELTNDLSLSINLLTEERGLELCNFTTDNDKSYLVKHSNNSSSTSSEARFKFFRKFTKKQFAPIARTLVDHQKDISEEVEIKVIQDYAFKLGEGALRINNQKENYDQTQSISINKDPSYISLVDISEDIPTLINDVSEFDSMIEQLATFYREKEIHISSIIAKALIEKSKLLCKFDESKGTTKNIQDIFNIMDNIYFKQETIKKYNTSNNLRKISILIGASLIKAKSNDLSKYYTEKYEKAFEKAPSHVKTILDDWDNEDIEISDGLQIRLDAFESQATIPDIITSSIPSIKVTTQDRSAPVKLTSKKSKHHNLRHKALTQYSSQPQSQRFSTLSTLSQSTKLSIIDTQVNTTSDSYISSQEGSSSSQVPSSLRFPQNNSQKRLISSQLNGSQQKSKKKKKKGGFA